LLGIFFKDNAANPISKDELIKRVNEIITDNSYHLTNSKKGEQETTNRCSIKRAEEYNF
jgi:hypothetical protein